MFIAGHDLVGEDCHLTGLHDVLGTISGHRNVMTDERCLLMQFYWVGVYLHWEFPDPKNGGTLVPDVWLYVVGIFP